MLCGSFCAMNSKFPDDLLSAFHDGEVTPSEETVVQIRAKASPEARQELQDYQRMSQLLRELPRQKAPPEFASAVLQKAERESLIPSEAASAGATIGSRSTRFSRRQLWTFGAVGITAVAAGIIALVNLPSVQHQPLAQKPGIAVAQRDEPATSTAMARSLPRTAEAVGGRESTLDAKVADRVTNGPQSWGFAKSSAPSPAATLGAPSAASKQVAAPAPVATTREAGAAKISDLDASRLTFPADLKTAKVGEAVDALEKDGDRVAVVRLTVVNQAEGLAGIQKLLVANDRRAVDSAAEKDKLSALYSLPKQGVAVDSASKARGRGDLVCVYVEGTRDDLVAVLHEVQNESFFQQMEVTSISAAQLERLSRRAVSPQNGKSEPVSLRQQVVTLPVAALSEIHSEKESAQHDEYKLMYEYANPALGKKSAPLAGETPPRSLAQPKAQASQAAPIEAPRRAGTMLREEEKVAGGGRSAKTKTHVPPRDATKVADAGRHSVQVFFVIDDQSAPSSARTPVIAHRPTVTPKPAAAKPAP